MKPIARLSVVLPAFAVIVLSGTSSAQAPPSLACTFERIATATLDKTGKLTTDSDVRAGEMVLANLGSASSTATGNLGAVKLQVLRRSSDTIWMAELNAE
jgi:hypothetical protein